MRSAIFALLITVLSTLNLLWIFPAAMPAGAAEIVKPSDAQVSPPDLSALAKESRWLELLSAASQASAGNAADTQALIYKLKAMRMLGDSDAALVQADLALASFPGDPGLLLERAWIQTFKAAWPKALADAQAASQGKPDLS